MTATTSSTALATIQPAFTDAERLALAGFLADDPVAQAVACQRVTFDARAPRCGRYGCATAGRVSWT